MFYAKKLRTNKVKVAFFSSTPQGGGVALMRHALVRFSRVMGVDLTWYGEWFSSSKGILGAMLTSSIVVPKPRPGVFRITKNVHNILQGVSHPDQRISTEEKAAIIDWIAENANRYWFSEGGPLRPASEGGADVIIVSLPWGPVIPSRNQISSPSKPFLKLQCSLPATGDVCNPPVPARRWIILLVVRCCERVWSNCPADRRSANAWLDPAHQEAHAGPSRTVPFAHSDPKRPGCAGRDSPA